MFPKIFWGIWERKSGPNLLAALSFLVFLFLDFLDAFLCIFFRYLDEFLEGKASPCCCENRGEQGNNVSETLYGFGRKNVFREMGFLRFPRNWEESKKVRGKSGGNRWSDCGCESCVSWMNFEGEQRLHFVVREPSSEASIEDCRRKPAENVIYLHGFLSSSSLWAETVFPNLSESIKHKYRMFAVDLLGFGRSPKPRDCLYTLKDHLEMIEKSLIFPFQLNSFHLVAHSMGCIIALALAAKYPQSVKSITLVAPPYFPSSQSGGGLTVLKKLAEKRLWPPLLFGSSVMSWYEHLGRCVCFFICRNHRRWEWIVKLLTHKRDLHFMVVDLTRHTHHSAWHTMHNVICRGSKLMDQYLEVLSKCRVQINVIQGDEDQVVPLECSIDIKKKVPDAKINFILNADHSTVIVGKQKDFTQNLEHIWESSANMNI